MKLYELQIANFVFSYHNHALPNIFSSYFSTNNQIHHHNIRASDKLHKIRFESNIHFYSIRIQGPLVWKSLGHEIQKKKLYHPS